MLLLQNKNPAELKYEMYFRRNKYDENGDIITYEHDQVRGNFFDILIWTNDNKLLSVLFDLDGYIVSLELRENGRKNAVIIMKRNYNGVFYIFPRNCLNLKNETIDYYLDYYNNNMVINNQYARRLMDEIYQIINCMKTKTENDIFLAMLGKALYHNIDDLFDSNFFQKQGYSTQLSVLPPNVRPDNNHNYTIIQVVNGCKIMSQRKRACGFCSSFGMKYHEYDIDELKEHIKHLLESSPCMTAQANCVFLSDGDPLIATNILQQIETIKNELPNIQSFEAFISTSSILSINSSKWNELLQSGLRKVYWGVESADDITLNIIDKPHDINMLNNAKKALEEHGIPYDIIIMSGIGLIHQANRTEFNLTENAHVENTVNFINSSKCSSVFISKLQISPNSAMARKINNTIFPFTENEMELQYRSLVKKLNKSVRGSYGNQFVVERIDTYEV